MNEKQLQTVERWHAFVENPDGTILQEIFAAEMKLWSPFLFQSKPKNFAMAALLTVSKVFEDFHYTRKFFAETACCLEFAAHIGDVELEGVDLIEIDSTGQITEFKVMIRPGRGLQVLVAEMTRRMETANIPVS